MATTLQLKDLDLIEEVNNHTLDPSFFNHEIRMRISWIYNKKYSLEEAITNYDALISPYLNKVATNQFNSFNLNKAYIEIIEHFMNKSTANSLEKLLREFPRLKYNFKALVKTHYGYDILKEDKKEDRRPNRPILFTF